MDGWIDVQKDMDKWIDGLMNGWMDGLMDRWMYGWMDGWVDRHMGKDE